MIAFVAAPWSGKLSRLAKGRHSTCRSARLRAGHKCFLCSVKAVNLAEGREGRARPGVPGPHPLTKRNWVHSLRHESYGILETGSERPGG